MITSVRCGVTVSTYSSFLIVSLVYPEYICTSLCFLCSVFYVCCKCKGNVCNPYLSLMFAIFMLLCKIIGHIWGSMTISFVILVYRFLRITTRMWVVRVQIVRIVNDFVAGLRSRYMLKVIESIIICISVKNDGGIRYFYDIISIGGLIIFKRENKRNISFPHFNMINWFLYNVL